MFARALYTRGRGGWLNAELIRVHIRASTPRGTVITIQDNQMSRLALRPSRLAAACLLAASTAVAQPARKSTPAKPSIPTPESVFGFKAGADSSLFLYDQSIEYFRKLAKAQPTRVKLMDVG